MGFEEQTAYAKAFSEPEISKELSPEKKLMLAILEDAIKCLQIRCVCENSARKNKKFCVYHDVVAWFNSAGDNWIFSFVNVCEGLKLSPEYVKKGLFAAKSPNSS